MATLNWPGFGITTASWTLDQPAQVNSSAYSGGRQVVSNPWHGKWQAHVQLATQQGDAAFRAARAFFTSLKGQISTFHLPAVEQAQNGNTGVTLASNAAQGAVSLSLTGVTTALQAGNMVTIAGQLLSVTSVGSLSGSAQTINFMPALRAAASSGASVETAKPYALMALTGSSFTWDIGSWRRYGLAFDCEEAIGDTDSADPALDVWSGGVSGSSGGGTSFSFPQLPSFTTRSLLAAIIGPASKQLAYLTEAGVDGLFQFETGNYSGQVAANGRDYVAPSSDATGASGAWVRKSRSKLTADLNLYARSDGNDKNDGTANTSGAAVATMQRAIDIAYSLDCNGFKVTITGTGEVGPALISGRMLGAKDSAYRPLQIIGNETTPANTSMTVSSSVALHLVNGAYAFVAGIHFGTTTGGNAWTVSDGSTLEHRNCEFGNVAQDMIAPQYHGTIRQVANADGSASTTNVIGNANAFVHFTLHSMVAFTDQIINFNGNSFSTYMWGGNDGTLDIDGATITGTQPLTGNTLIHDQSLFNTYSMVNAGGWGYASKGGTILIQDGSTITSTLLQGRTFYVRSDANGNSNDGLENTVGRAFKSIQSCIDFIASLPFNPANYNDANGVLILIADGTYNETIHLRNLKAYIAGTITGNTTTPANVVINGTDDAVAGVNVATPWVVEGMKLVPAAGQCLRAEQGTQVSFDNIEFPANAGKSHISALTGARIFATGNYKISGGATQHILAQGDAYVDLSGRTVTITGTPTFSSFIQADRCAVVYLGSVTWSGAATGNRFAVSTQAMIDTGGAGDSSIPGNTAGTTASGGRTDSTASGSGTVTTVSVATANGFSGTVANPTTTPAITMGVADVNAAASNLHAGYVLGQSAAAASHTGDTTETTLATVTVPANSMGANGRVQVYAIFSYTNNADSKTPRIRFGGTAIVAGVVTTTAVFPAFTQIANRGVTNSQVATAGTGFGPSNSAQIVTAAIDTTADVALTFTGQLGTSTDTIRLESYQVILYPNS